MAERYHIKGRGAIVEGNYADLAVINPIKNFTVTEDSIESICKWSPFTGHTFSNTVEKTIVNGVLCADNGKIVAKAPAMALEFDR